jgi:hypothetical protein
MNQRIRTVLFIVSALLLLTGTVLYIVDQTISPYLFAVGAAGLTLGYATEPNKETDLRKRRLQRYNLIAGVLMIAASMLMFNNRNEWILCLSIAAFLQLYAAFVYPKDDKKGK